MDDPGCGADGQREPEEDGGHADEKAERFEPDSTARSWLDIALGPAVQILNALASGFGRQCFLPPNSGRCP
jgi:hypothetical protein